MWLWGGLRTGHWAQMEKKLGHMHMPHDYFQTQNLHVHMPHASLPHAKFTCARKLSIFPRAKFARTRELTNTNHPAICSTTFATAFAWCLFHFWTRNICMCTRVMLAFRTQNLHVHATHASCPNAKFACARMLSTKYPRKICTHT